MTPASPPGSPSRRAPLAGRLGLLVLGLAVGLGLAEALARTWPALPGEALLFNAPDGSPPGLYRHDPQLLLEPVPGFVGRARSLGYEVDVRIDGQGLRGRGARGPAPRILTVGDSFTLGVQVAEEDTFQTHLARRLGRDVLNAGVDSYSTWQAVDRYLRLEGAVEADTVVLVFFLGNDLTDNHRVAEERRHPEQVAPPPPPPWSNPVWRILVNRSVLFGYARVAWRRWSVPRSADGARMRTELALFSASGGEALRTCLSDTEPPLRTLARAAAERSDRVLVALAPPAFALDPDEAARTLGAFDLADPTPNAPRDAVRAALGRAGLGACDLTEPLRLAAARGEAPFLRFDGHWSPAGHRVVAEALAGCLAEAAPGAASAPPE